MEEAEITVDGNWANDIWEALIDATSAIKIELKIGDGKIDTNGGIVNKLVKDIANAALGAGGWRRTASHIVAAIATRALYPYEDRTIIWDGTVGSCGVLMYAGNAAFGIPSPDEFDALGLDWEDLRQSTEESCKYPKTIPRDLTLLKERNNPAVYVVEEGRKRWIVNPETFEAAGFDWGKIVTLPPGGLNMIPNGSPFTGF